MAQLKDSLITGDLRVTGTIYGDANLSSLNASGTGLGTNGQILTSTGTGLAWSNNVTPSSHTHGQITNDGKIASNTTIATADSIVYSDASDDNKLKKDSAKNVANALINSLDTGSSVLTANDYVITQYVNGGTTTTTYHRRPASALRVGGLLTARNLGVNLASTTAVTFDGTANQTNIPVSGTLPIANGGTGQTTIEAVRKSWKVIAEKDYTGVIASANNDAGGIFHFLKIRPTTFNAQWTVKGKIWATTPAGTLYTHNTEFMITGDTNTYRTYSNFNTRNNSATLYYYIVPYCLKEAGYNAGYSHCLGINLRYATNNTNTNWTRNFHIEIWESDNCTIEFFDTMTAHGSVPGYGTTNYNNYWNLNAVDIGLQETSDANDVNYYNREQYDSKKAKNAIKRYMLLLSVDDEYVMGVTEVDNSTATTKAMSTEKFDPFREIFFWQSTTTYAAGANIGDGMYRQYLCDIRYALNVGGYQSTSVLTARKPLYLVASPTDDGMATLHTTPFSQSLPTTNDGLLYIYLGMVYPDTNPYRLYLTLKHPVYKYTSSGVKEIIPAAEMDTAGNVISTTYAKKSDLTNLVAATDAMIFKGTLGTGGTITALPNSHTRGDTYRVITAGTYAGVVCEIGDLIMCINSGTAAANADWTVAQTNIDGAVIGPASVTSGHVVTFNGGTGKLIQDSGYTIASNVPANAKFTDTNYYHTTGSWNGLTYTATANGGAGALALTIPTGTTGTTVALGNHIHGKITNDGKIASTDNVIIANNDRLIISDASDNYILKNTSIVFDGSTTTKALTQKGTWETFNNYSHPTGDGNKHVPANGTSNNGKFLQATETAGTYQWASLPTASTGAAGIIQIGTGATNAAAGNHNHDSAYVNVSGDTMTGTLTMKGSDIVLGTSGTSSDDSGDLSWTYGNGQEKMRIWSQNTYTAKSGPNFRVYKSDGTSLYSGTLSLADHTHATSIATSSGTNQITLALGTKYAITAGGTSYVFTMPANPNTDIKQNITLNTTTKGYITAVETAPTSTAATQEGIADTGVYLTTTAGQINATTYKINEKSYISYDTTVDAIGFTFV